MGQIDSGSKSSRLLASRRYTHNTLTSAQESFTNVLDLRAEEIYTRAHLIPSSSLPHSGSSQRMAEFTKEGQTVTKYWYRHKLTKSNTNNEVWFFLNPTGSNDGIGAQLIDSNQQTSFISPKYAVASLATSTTADSTPGYLAAVYKSTSTNTSSLDGDDIVSTNDYQFDYKTGVLQFKSSAVDPTDSQYLYMTAYQYVGQTLKTGLEIQGPFTASNVTITGESDITTFGSTAQSMISGSWKGELSSSLVKVAGGGVSGSSTSTGSFAYINVTSKLSGSSVSTGSFAHITATSKVSGSSVSTGSFAHITATSKVSGSSSSTGSFGQVFVGDRLVFKDHQDSGEYIESDGTDLSINVGSSGDINIPANIGLTFGNDGEKIEGDGTDLTIAGNNINLTAVADVNIPSGVGITFATTEKIESDGTDLSITVGSNGDINIPADIGLTFGDDGEKIEGDGTDLTITGNNIVLSPTADVKIPVNKGLMLGTHEKIESDDTDLTITVGSGGDINIGSDIGLTFGDDGEKIEGDGTDLTIASSNDLHLTATTDINVPSDVGLTFGDDGEKIEGDGTDLTIASSNDLNLTATTDINIPSAVGLTFGNDGEKIEGDGTDLTIASSGVLTLSSTGNTIIETVTINNGDVTIPGNLTVTGDRLEAQVGSLQVADHTITVGSGSATSALMEAGGLDFGISGSIANLRYQHATTSLTSSVFLKAPKLTVDTITVDGSEIDASGALTIDTGGDLSLDATGDINIPADIGLTFGDDGEKIEGDGTDLTIASSNLLNLTATTDVKIPVNVGLMLGTHEKIESDDTDLTITVGSGGDINIGSGIGLTFGDDGEKIEGDGTDLTIASSNDLHLTATTDINIPADVGLTFGNDGEKIEGDGTDLTIAGNNIVLSPTADVKIPVNKGLMLGTHEKIESDDTDLTITVGSGGDINIGSGIGLTFGDDGEKIEGDGTDLTIASSNELNLSATTDVVIPVDVGLHFGDGNEKIESDNTDLTLNSGVDINLTATNDVNIPSGVGVTFGNDGEKIEGDGTHLTIASSDKLKLDVATDLEIDVDGGDIKITDDGAHVADISATAISGSSISTGSFAYVNVTSKISGSSVSTGSFGRLEILGDADIDGTLETDALTINGTTLSETISDTVGAMVGSNTETGMAVTYEDGDNTLDFVINAAQTTITSLFATDIKIGEDNETRIDFGTANEIHFYAGNQRQLDLEDGVLAPTSDSDVDLGNSSQYFKDAYIDSIITTGNVSGSTVSTGSFAYVNVTSKVSGSSVSTGSFGRLELAGNANIAGNITLGGNINIGDADTDDIVLGGEIKSNIIPDADATYDLGSSTKGWNDLHLGSGGVINLDGGDVTLTHSSNLVTIAGGSTRVDKLEIDGANDHIDVSTDMVLTAAADITLTPGGANVKPGSDSAIDLGVSGTAFRELFVDAIDLNGQGSISVGGTGRIDLDGDDDTSIRASADDVITFEAGAVDIAQVTATQAISGSSISTGSFGRLELAGNASIDGDLTLGGNITIGDADSDSITINADLTSNLIPNADNTYDLGSSAKQWKDIYINGIGYIDQLGTDADPVAAYISSGELDGTVIGGESAAAATVTTLSATGDVDLGDATSDTITATARFDSDIVPSTDSARDLGTSALQFAEAHIDTGYIDAITATGTSTLSTVDIGAGAIDGTTIGASSAAAATFTTVATSGNVSGSSVSTGSFGKVLGDASDMTGVTDDGALAFSIVFGG